jgi:hypothetical protein
MSLDLAAVLETVVHELSPDFLAELPPHFVFAGTKPTHVMTPRNLVFLLVNRTQGM